MIDRPRIYFARCLLDSSFIFRQHSVSEAQVYDEFLWTLRALSERFEKYLSVFIFYLICIRVACPVLYDVKLDIVLYDVKLDSVKSPDRDDALVFQVWMQHSTTVRRTAFVR